MGDDITIGVTEIVNNIEVTAQPNDQIIDIDVVDNSDDVTLNITPTVVEININRGSSFAKWGTILGNLPDQEDLQNVLNLKADLVGGLVPASQLPSYVDDIVEVANYAALPVVGETGKIYLTLDNNKIFRWSGSVYIEIAANNAIWGAITGTLSSQTDLQTALDTKALKTITITPNAPLSGGGDLSANRTISISQSNSTTDGYLSSTDWSKFNSAVPAGTPTTGDFVFYNGSNLAYKALLASAPLSFNSGTGTFSISQANTTTNGYLSSTDWNTFNNKQPSLIGVGFVKISGTTISYDNSTYALDNSVVHIAGTETITGVKTFTSQMTAAKILMSNSTTDRSLELTNSGQGQSIYVVNTGLGTGIQNLNNGNSGVGFMSANSLTATGNLYQGNFNGGRVFSVGSEGSGYFAKNVAIGTTTAAVRLQVQDSANTFVSHFSGLNQTNGIAIGTNSSNVALIQGYTRTFSATNNIAINADGGNVGIGTTSPDQKLTVEGNIRAGGVGNGFLLDTTGVNYTNGMKVVNNYETVMFSGRGSAGYVIAGDNNLRFGFGTNYSAGESMRITSGGSVLLGTTDTGFNARQLIRFEASGASTRGLAIWNGGGEGSVYVAFANSGGGFTGTITQTASGVAYNTTSDYRLKQDFKQFNGLDLVSKIKVYDYEWKVDKSRMNGVIAHELQEVIPYAVTGEKDAKEMQQVDYSKLVPILVQAIKELNDKINKLENK